MQRGSTAIKDMPNQIGVISISIVLGSIRLLRITLGRPTCLSDKNSNIGDIKVLHGEISGVDHSVEDVGVVKQGVGVDHFLIRSEGFEESIVERNHAFILHEDVVGVKVHRERGTGSRKELKERENNGNEGLVEVSLRGRERVENDGSSVRG